MAQIDSGWAREPIDEGGPRVDVKNVLKGLYASTVGHSNINELKELALPGLGPGHPLMPLSNAMAGKLDIFVDSPPK